MDPSRGGWKSQTGAGMTGFCGQLPSWLVDGRLRCVLMWTENSALSSHRDPNPVTQPLPLRPHDLLKAPLPYTITRGVRASTSEFGGMQTFSPSHPCGEKVSPSELCFLLKTSPAEGSSLLSDMSSSRMISLVS